jgi:hypothetical protein
MTKYCQRLAPGLTLLKQFVTRTCIIHYEGPYV